MRSSSDGTWSNVVSAAIDSLDGALVPGGGFPIHSGRGAAVDAAGELSWFRSGLFSRSRAMMTPAVADT